MSRTPSDRLRQAAARIREHTRKAMGGTPWRAAPSLPFPSIRTQRGTEIASVTYPDRFDDAAYIALMHPGVAHRVADLLESVAEDWAALEAHNAAALRLNDDEMREDPYMHDALALADALTTTTEDPR